MRSSTEEGTLLRSYIDLCLLLYPCGQCLWTAHAVELPVCTFQHNFFVFVPMSVYGSEGEIWLYYWYSMMIYYFVLHFKTHSCGQCNFNLVAARRDFSIINWIKDTCQEKVMWMLQIFWRFTPPCDVIRIRRGWSRTWDRNPPRCLDTGGCWGSRWGDDDSAEDWRRLGWRWVTRVTEWLRQRGEGI